MAVKFEELKVLLSLMEWDHFQRIKKEMGMRNDVQVVRRFMSLYDEKKMRRD